MDNTHLYVFCSIVQSMKSQTRHNNVIQGDPGIGKYTLLCLYTVLYNIGYVFMTVQYFDFFLSTVWFLMCFLTYTTT